MTVALRATTAAATIVGSPPVLQNLDASGGTLPNENPKAAIYLASAATALGTAAATSRLNVGITDGTTQHATATQMDNSVGAATADAQTRFDDATVINMPNAGNGLLEGEASWSAWRNNGSEISWGDLLATAKQVGAIYFFGTEVQASVQTLTTSASIGGTADITGLSFRPNLFILTTHDTTPDFDSPNMKIGILLACEGSGGVIQQGGMWISALDRAGAVTALAQSIRNDGLKRVLAGITPGHSEGAKVSLQTILDDGGRFLTEEVAQSLIFTVLCLRIPRALWVGQPTFSTSSTGNKPITDPGFRPLAYFMLATGMQTMNSIVDGGDAGRFSFGVSTGDDDLCGGVQSEDGAATSNSSSILALDVAHVLNDGGTIDWSASHVSFGAAGPTINVDDASPNDKVCIMLAIGAAGRDPGWWDAKPPRRWARSLARR